MRVIQNFKGVILCATVLSIGCALAGIVLSILFSTPVGATIVAAEIVVFFVNCLIGKLIKS